MSTRIAIFDLETTGLINGYHAKYTDLDAFRNARIIQIAMLVYDFAIDEQQDSHGSNDIPQSTHKLVKTYYYTILPDDFIIRNKHIHNISQQYAIENGIPFKKVIMDMYCILKSIDIIVAHNIGFDFPILQSELHRYGFDELNQKLNTVALYCTMANTAKLLKIGPSPYKWPKLAELHDYLFKGKTYNKHNALLDVKTLAKCFWKMYKLNLFRIEKKDIWLNY